MSRRTAPEDIAIRQERVRDMTRNGHSARDIAAALRVTERTVVRDRNALGISLDRAPQISAERWARAEALIADGCSLREVARTVGVASITVRRHYPHAGFSPQESGRWAAFCRDAQRKGLA